jgi:hypothetical protein
MCYVMLCVVADRSSSRFWNYYDKEYLSQIDSWCQAYVPHDHAYLHDVTNNVSESRNSVFKKHSLLSNISSCTESGLTRLFKAMYDEALSNLREAEEAQQKTNNHEDMGLSQATQKQYGVKRTSVDKL